PVRGPTTLGRGPHEGGGSIPVSVSGPWRHGAGSSTRAVGTVLARCGAASARPGRSQPGVACNGTEALYGATRWRRSCREGSRGKGGTEGGTPAIGPFRPEGHEPEAGDRDRPVRSTSRGRQGPEEVDGTPLSPPY